MSHASDIRNGFLGALEADEDDEGARMAFSDWLEEVGDDDEADRQRRWTASKAWLVDLCGGRIESTRDEDWHGLSIGYKDLIELGHEGISHGSANCGSDESMQDRLYEAGLTFWHHWATVTGVKLPEDLEEHSIYFGCAC